MFTAALSIVAKSEKYPDVHEQQVNRACALLNFLGNRMNKRPIRVQLGWISRESCQVGKSSGYLPTIWVHLHDILDSNIIEEYTVDWQLPWVKDWVWEVQWVLCLWKGHGSSLAVMEVFWVLTGSMLVYWVWCFTVWENCVKGTLFLRIIIIIIFEDGWQGLSIY